MSGVQWEAWCRCLGDGANDLRIDLFQRSICSASWRITRRVLPWHLCYLVQRGTVTATSREQTRVVGPGSVLWVRPEEPHQFALADGCTGLVVIHLRFALAQAPSVPSVSVIESAQDAEPFFMQALDAYRHEPVLRHERIRWSLASFFAVLAQLDRDTAVGHGLTAEQRVALEAWLERHVAHAPSPRDLARVVGLSPAWFSRRFKRTYGISPRSWIARQRIGHAARLLEDTDEAIQTIAEAVGFAGLFGFSRQFKAVMGISPSAHRDRARQSGPSRGCVLSRGSVVARSWLSR